MANELKTDRIALVITPSEVEAIDAWRRSQPKLISRSEAIRSLIRTSLSALASPADHDSVILVVNRDLFEQLEAAVTGLATITHDIRDAARYTLKSDPAPPSGAVRPRRPRENK